MNKKFFIIIATVVIAVVGGYFFYNNYLYKDARNIAEEKVSHTVTADSIISDYETNANIANEKYLNKTIAVQGTVTQVNDSAITVNNTVFCALEDKEELFVDEAVTVKGRCIGYDEIFGEVKLDQCTIMTN